ncbi:MAG: CopD family protein [Anaerolineae bacterium]|nr:CopD family protein [Anaerolineae bacterium]
MIHDWLLALSFFLHLVATVVWIGGLALLTVLVWPEARALLARSDQSCVLLDFLERLRKRFNPLANLSLIVLIVTGLFQMDKSPHYDGLMQLTNDWTRAILLKHIAALGMVIIGAVMQWVIIPALERATLLVRRGKDAPDLEQLRHRERQLTALNFVLGMIVLLFTAVATSI